MTITDSASPQLAAATAYQDFFVPALFEEWAPRLVEAARIEPGQHVLDVACGTGVLAREAASRTGPRGRVAGLDANPGMLAVAARLNPEIEWREGQAEALPFPDGSFDAVVSQFGLMFFSDRLRALREMQRVLKPGGRLAVAVWDSLDNTPTYEREVAILRRVAGQAAADALRLPFVLGDRAALKQLFTDAGMPSATLTTHRGRGRFPSVRALVSADLTGWLPLMGVMLTEGEIQRIVSAAEDELRPWVSADGSYVFDSPAHIVTASKPFEA